MIKANGIIDKLAMSGNELSNTTRNNNPNDKNTISKTYQHGYVQEIQASLIMRAELKNI